MPPITRRGFLLAPALLQDASPQRLRRPPNVLIYMPAALRACDLDAPNFQRIAAEGIRFVNAISTVPAAGPARAMLQTGCLPMRTGFLYNGLNLRSGSRIAEAFAQAGYHTAYVGYWGLAAGRLAGSLDRAHPAPRANAHMEFVPPGPLRLGYREWHVFNHHTEYARPYFYRDEPRRLLMQGYETDAETTMAIEVMHQAHLSNQPFFVVAAPHPPHPPFRADHTPPEALAKIPAELKWRANVRRFDTGEETDPRCYYAMIRNADENLGKILAYLDKNDLAENTIVVCLSDHGEMLFSHGRLGAAMPFDESVRIPWFMRWPGKLSGTHSGFATPVDVFPTLAALCSVPVPSGLDGVDLLARGPQRTFVRIANYSGHPDYPEDGPDEWRGILGPHLYVRWLHTGGEEYFEDPYQQLNLVTRNPKGLTVARARMAAWQRESPDDFHRGSWYARWATPARNIVR